MNENERFSSYLAARAGTIELPPGDPATTHRRAQRRRHRRRAGTVGVAAVIATIGVTVALTAGRDDSSLSAVAGPGAAAVASPLQWQLVDTSTGLGWSAGSVVSGPEGLYALSTAPGPISEDGVEGDGRQHLYRSSDGAEWSELDLPGDLWASSLASSGEHLYALGTSPAGGGTRTFVVASSDDGGQEWSSATLGDEVGELLDRYPGQVMTNGLSVATGPGGVVAALSVRAWPDVAALVAAVDPSVDVEAGWNLTAAGVDILGRSEDCTEASTMTTVVTDEAGRAVVGAVRAACAAGSAEAPVLRSFTWEQLGLDPVLRDLLDGRTFVYAADADGFVPVELPAGADAGTAPRLVGYDGGYALALGRQSSGAWDTTTAVLRSADGRTWTEDAAAATPGYPSDAGLLAGRPAIAVYGEDGSTVRVLGAGGTWDTLDLTSALSAVPEGAEYSVYGISFGPLGLAAGVSTFDEQDGGTIDLFVVHSLDGRELSVLEVDDYVDLDEASLVGITISADAVVVRLGMPTDDDPSTPVRQRAIVGTLT